MVGLLDDMSMIFSADNTHCRTLLPFFLFRDLSYNYACCFRLLLLRCLKLQLY